MTVIIKTCARCKSEKSTSEFHQHKPSKFGVHSYCKICQNAAQKKSRDTRGRKAYKEQKQKWGYATRYRLTVEQVNAMRAEQCGLCAICRGMMDRPCIDHCHKTSKVRGILCHRCNIRLTAFDDVPYRNAAIDYLGMERIERLMP